jgi:hypothetical protein
VQSRLRGTWVVIDSDDPPKEVGIASWVWNGSADIVAEVEGYIVTTSIYGDAVQKHDIFFALPGCTEQAYYINALRYDA